MSKRILSLCICIAFSVTHSYAQKSLKENLQGEWVKEKISLADGSPIYQDELNNAAFALDFRGDSLITFYENKYTLHSFDVKDSILSYNNVLYKIVRLEKPILEISQYIKSDEVEPLLIKMVFKPTIDLSLPVNFYAAKNGEKVFEFQPGILEPKFLSSKFSAMDYIYSYFNYPEYKKGGFVVRFVITKTGKMEGLRIEASSNNKYDQRLINAVKKTEGKWLPAKYQGQNVNCEVELNYDLGWSKEPTMDNPAEVNKRAAVEYYDYGKYYFEEKNYKNAVFYLSKAIEKDPFQVSAYYMRASSYILLRKKKEACEDFQTLISLGQKKAEEYLDKYCN